MAITIGWAAKIIYVPRADMALIQSSPLEIRELNLNVFRMALKALEASEEGMPFLDTHNHNAEVSVGGVTLAMVVEIINGYTITFEDGQYAVNLVGANSNVADVVNVNQVSVRSANSAGLIQTREIEHASFDDAVHLSVGGVAGTLYPTGTPRQPVNNLTDAVLIASVRGFNKLCFDSDWTFINGDMLVNLVLEGQGWQKTTFTFEPGSAIAYCTVHSARCTGWVIGVVGLYDCTLDDLGGVGVGPDDSDLVVKDCLVVGTTTLPSEWSGNITVLDCWSSPKADGSHPILNVNGTPANIHIRNYTGNLTVAGVTSSSSKVQVLLGAGTVVLDSTITAGDFLLSGVGKLINNATSVTSIDHSGLVSRESIWTALGDSVYLDVDQGVAGTAFPLGTVGDPVNNIADALAIATENGLNRIVVSGQFVMTEDLTDLTIVSRDAFVGRNSFLDNVINLNGKAYTRVTFVGTVLTGAMVGDDVEFNSSYLVDVAGLTGEAFDCRIEGSLVLGGYFSGVGFVVEGDTTTVDFDSNPAAVFSADVASGYIFVTNMVAGSLLEVNLRGGELDLDGDTCTGGDFYAEGYGTLFDSADLLGQGVLTTKANHLVALETIPPYVLEEGVASHAGVAGSLADIVNKTYAARLSIAQQAALDNDIPLIRKLLKNRLELAEGSVNNWVLYDDDGVTPLITWNVSGPGGAAIRISSTAPARRRPV